MSTTGSGLSFCMHWLSIIIVAMPICCCCDDGIGRIMPIVSDANVTIFAEFYFHFELFFYSGNFPKLFPLCLLFCSFVWIVYPALLCFFRMNFDGLQLFFWKSFFLFQMNFYEMLIFRSLVLQFSLLLLPKQGLAIFFSVCL